MVGFVICGLEHSGTTLVSELLRQAPGVDAGFEIGVLLGDTPRAFPLINPYADHMLWGWGISHATLLDCCDTKDFATFYARLHLAATVLRPGTHTIFDKTPRYLRHLHDCMTKTAAPFIITCKDPRATVYSDFKSSGETNFDIWFDEYAEDKRGYMRFNYAEFERAAAARDPRIHVVRLEELCLYPRIIAAMIFAHVGLSFDVGYLAFRPARYQNTRASSIAAGVPFEYVHGLGAERSRRVARAFAEFHGWFYE